MLNILMTLLLCVSIHSEPYSTYQDRQAVHCVVQDTYLACYDTQFSSSYFYVPDAVDPSGEGYSCFFVSRNYTSLTNSYACFDTLVTPVSGSLIDGWIVRDYPE